MKSTDFLIETIVDDAAEMHQDHEVQMARKECYHAAENAIALHKLLRSINESTNLEAWVSSKITLANDYLNSVREHLEYQILQGDGQLLSNAPVIAEEDSKKKLVDSVNLSEVTPEQRREKFQRELGNERGNNIAVYINDKLWRVVPGRGLADSAEEYNYLQYWRRKAALKTQQTGSKWEAHLTGQEPGKPVRGVKESSKLQTTRNSKNSGMMEQDVSTDLNEMDKSAPQPGRDGKVSHSTYGSRDKKGSDYFKGKELPVKPITVKQMEKDALAILKKKGVAEESGISKSAENKFHTKLDRLVHDTFGKRKSEMEEGAKDSQTSTTVPNLQKPRQGPLKPQTGGGKHRDKKREQKSGIAKHRKSIADALNETSAGAVATVINPGGKPKSQVGSLFGGTYKQTTVKETDFAAEKAKPKQIPGDQVRGNEPAVRKNGKTAFLGRLVGNQ